MSKREHEPGAIKKSTKLGGGQTLETPYGKDHDDREVTPDRMRGGMNNISHTLPGVKSPVNGGVDD